MWIVTLANNSEFLKKELLKKFSNTKIYFPKVKLKKNKIKNSYVRKNRILLSFIIGYQNILRKQAIIKS